MNMNYRSSRVVKSRELPSVLAEIKASTCKRDGPQKGEHLGSGKGLTTLPRATTLRKVEVLRLADPSSTSSSARSAAACTMDSDSWLSSSIASIAVGTEEIRISAATDQGPTQDPVARRIRGGMQKNSGSGVPTRNPSGEQNRGRSRSKTSRRRGSVIGSSERAKERSEGEKDGRRLHRRTAASSSTAEGEQGGRGREKGGG